MSSCCKNIALLRGKCPPVLALTGFGDLHLEENYKTTCDRRTVAALPIYRLAEFRGISFFPSFARELDPTSFHGIGLSIAQVLCSPMGLKPIFLFALGSRVPRHGCFFPRVGCGLAVVSWYLVQYFNENCDLPGSEGCGGLVMARCCDTRCGEERTCFFMELEILEIGTPARAGR